MEFPALQPWGGVMGRTVGGGEAAATSRDVGGTFSQRKVAWCDRYLAEHGDEPALVAAYTAKRAKERSAAEELFSPEAMRAAYELVEASLAGFELKLERADTPWLHGDTPTMADLFWGIELLRMQNVGVAHYWEDARLPRVERFLAAAERMPALRAAVIDRRGRDQVEIGGRRALIGAAEHREVGGAVPSLAVDQHQGVIGAEPA